MCTWYFCLRKCMMLQIQCKTAVSNDVDFCVENMILWLMCFFRSLMTNCNPVTMVITFGKPVDLLVTLLNAYVSILIQSHMGYCMCNLQRHVLQNMPAYKVLYPQGKLHKRAYLHANVSDTVVQTAFPSMPGDRLNIKMSLYWDGTPFT